MTTDKLDSRINNLEILFSEQEYTVESLNKVVIRQALEIEQLTIKTELLKHQLQEFKKQMPDEDAANGAITDERPPHY